MSKFLKISIGFFLLLASCGSGGSFKEHRSASGLYPEEFLPANPGLVLSYSLMDEEQNLALSTLMEKIGDKDKASKAVTESFNSNLNALGLDYAKDLSPAFGEKFRVVFENIQNGEVNSGYSVITLADSNKMLAVLDTLAGSGKVSKKSFPDFDAYVSEENQFYASVKEDLLLIGNSPDALSAMIAAGSGENLWASDSYKDTIKKIGANHVLYALIFPENAGSDSSILSLRGMASVLNEEGLILRAEEDGFKFEGYAKADPARAKEKGIAFNDVPAEKAYLHNELSAKNLMVYFESYGLNQALTKAGNFDENPGYKSFATTVQNYLGMSLEDEILSFMDKGYSVLLSTNGEAAFPGISIYFDISSDQENAEKFISKIDGQITGYMTVLSAVLPDAVTKAKKEVMGEQFDSLKIDFSKIASAKSLPEILTKSPVELSYGIVKNRLLITTANFFDGDKIADAELYKNLSSKLDDSKEGLILLDASQIATFAGVLRELREKLGLAVDDTFDVQKALEGFGGAIASSSTSEYEAELEGFLGIKE